MRSGSTKLRSRHSAAPPRPCCTWPASATIPRSRNRVARREYRLLPFTDDFGAALAAADLVVARAGGSVWEIAAAGRPALLVPYPHATADHQTENARYFERGGGAVVVPEPELDLRRQVEELLADPERLQTDG